MTRFAFASFALTLFISAPAQAQYFTDTGSPANPAWSTIFPTLNNDAPDPGPVLGSVINVNNSLTEVGLYGDRSISVGPQRIHIPCNTSTTNLADFTRWFQTDGNTQVFRLFVNDENTASSRVGAARTEAFTETKWIPADNVTYEWTGRYTIAARQQSHVIFQVMNSDNEWAVQLNLGGNGELKINNRRNSGDVILTNPDGSNKDFDGQGFDLRVHDDGLNYKVWIDGVLLADNFYDRPTGDTNFRWGMYMGDNILTAPSTSSTILVSGAQVKSWSGDLTTAITTVTKANNNAQNLSAGGSWLGGTAPGLYEQALWNSTVNAINCDTTLNADQVWSGIKITSPDAQVTINGTATLGLDRSGVDMSMATRNLVVNCPVELRVTAPWNIASSVNATFSDTLKGYGGITLGGNGTVILSGANTFTGGATISNGSLRAAANDALGTGSIRVEGGSANTGALEFTGNIAIANEVVLSGRQATTSDAPHLNNISGNNTFSGAITLTTGGSQYIIGSAAGQLTITGNITGTGSVTGARTLNFSGAGNGLASGNITDGTATFSLVKLDAGMWTLTGTNTYTGITTISEGTLQLGNNTTTGALTETTGIVNNGNLTIRRSTGFNQSTGLNNQPITGSGTLTQAGASTTTLSAANSYAGNTTISAGILKLAAAGVIPDGAGKGNVVMNPASGTATLDLAGFNETINGLSNSGAGSSVVDNTATGAATLTIGGNNSTSSFSGTIKNTAGALALTKVGTGTLTLTAANTYTGPTTISAGTLAFSVTAPFASTSGIAMADATLLQPLIGGATISKPITLGAAGTTASISAPTNLPGAGVVSALNLGGIISGSGNVTFTSSANQNALSTVVLNAPNNYTGDTLLDTAGNSNTQIIVRLGTTNALPVSTVLTIDGQVGDGTGRFVEVNLNGFSQELAGLTNVARSLRVQRIVNSNVSNPATLTINNSDNYIFSGTLGGSAAGSVSGSAMPGSTSGNNLALTKKGAGTLTLSGSNTYTGPTTVMAGSLIVTSSLPNNDKANVLLAAPDSTLTGNATLTRPIAAGLNTYAGFGSTVTAASLDPVLGAPLQTTAEILMSGTNAAANTMTMQWRKRTTAEAARSNPNAVLSDVISLTGMGSDIFVLQMSYTNAVLMNMGLNENAIATSGELRLGWKNGSNWVTAVAGNAGGTPKFAGVTDWSSYYTTRSSFDNGSDLASFLGTYGVDPDTNTVWAVINHNSEFAVIPEPSTLVLGGLALLGFAGAGLRKRRLAKQQA